MISVNNLSIHFTGTDLFSNASFLVNDRDRIGLVGKNGSGKTTLLNIIAGKLIPQEGDVVIPSGTTIGFLRQEMDTLSNRTIFDEALTAFAETLKLEETIHQLTREIAERTDYESKEYHRLIHNLTEANERFHIIGGQSVEGETENTVTPDTVIIKMKISDKTVIDLFTDFGDNAGIFLAPYLKKFNAGILVIGGNISHAYNLFGDVFENRLRSENCSCEVAISKLKEDAALIGSAYMHNDAFWKSVQHALPLM